eukprot:gnl/MRDRNA2_/MRDRNA2_163420_c0_seq1.p1 gnl/MRDRNA2_/MRDRNA2_163420_c0~~gnl/MRDRNA2_/MRDRNA2_163420_c0_seq1.p1  ORF type:complete len:489 (+),score=99.30 gnl/MRDRNA2_/MRDRNA2_163420_c0_seq1:58-1467(+)
MDAEESKSKKIVKRDSEVRSGFLSRIVLSENFGYVCGIAILVNSITIGLAANQAVTNPQEPLPEIFNVFELIFGAFFLLELLLRLVVEKSNFFCSEDWKWNWFDFIVVFLAVLDEIVRAVGADKVGLNITFVRVFRVLRLVRIIRTVRVLRFFHELRVMVQSVMSCVRSLFWSSILLLLVMYIYAVHLTQHVADVLKSGMGTFGDNPESEETIENLKKWYGSLGRAILSLLQAISGGADWGDLLEPLVESSSLPFMHALVFAAYIIFTSVALLNVVTGVFVDNAMKATAEDKEMVIHDQLKTQHSAVNDVKRLFEETDGNGSGEVSWEEFEQHLENPKVQAYFSSLELDASEARGLFKLLDIDGNGTVNRNEFIMGCMRLKGHAKSVDVATLMYENKKMLAKWTSFMAFCEDQFNRVALMEQRILQKQAAVNTIPEALAMPRQEVKQKAVVPPLRLPPNHTAQDPHSVI